MEVAADVDRCEVWVARVPPVTDHLAGVLDDTELARRERFHQATDRDRFTAAAALLRLVAARFVGVPASAVAVDRTCEHCGRPHGRPRIAGSEAASLDVSVSHAGRYAAIAACLGHRVGIDIETIRPDYADLLDAACTPAEAARVHTPRDFAATWVRKEAVLKATGAGLATPPRDVAVSGPGEPPRVVRLADGAASAWQLHDIAVDADHAGAVAIEATRPVRLDIVAFELPDARPLRA